MGALITTWFWRLIGYGASYAHPMTILRTFGAAGRGATVVLTIGIKFLRAKDMLALEAANPTKHVQEMQKRRMMFWGLVSIDLIGLLWLWSEVPFGGWIWLLVHFSTLLWIGRTGPLVHHVRMSKLATESIIRNIVDEITLSPTDRKNEARSDITAPPARLAHTGGYEVHVRVHRVGKPDRLEDGAPAIAHKLRTGKRQVFVYRVTSDASVFRIVVLDQDPWESEPTASPIARDPRQVSVWTDWADLGKLPDSTPYTRRLTEEGDGVSVLIGGAPRRGKSVLIRGILSWILCDSYAQVHMIDGKGLDYVDAKALCASYIGEEDVSETKLLHYAIDLMTSLKDEIVRRKKILRDLEATHLTEKICQQYDLYTQWLIIDELATFTEDMRTLDKKGVERFLELLQYLVRMGPAFGIYTVLATQRPNERVIPPSLKGMIATRIALYVPDQPASFAILGKAGDTMRADYLDKEQKGVGIIAGEGQVRFHMVTKGDFAKICRYAAALRSTMHKGAPQAGAERPPLIAACLEIIGDRRAIPTRALLSTLEEKGYVYTERTLAQALRPYGITSNTHRYDDHSKAKGYLKELFEKVPRIVPTGGRSVADDDRHVRGTTDATDDQDDAGHGWAANEGEDRP